jgi:hypothetical protein
MTIIQTPWRKPLIALFVLLTFGTSCKKFVQVTAPPTAISSGTVYQNDLSSAAVLTSIYNKMMTNGQMSSGSQSISTLTGLAADELDNYSTTSPLFSTCYTNSLKSSLVYFWTELYQRIYTANAALEGMAKSDAISPAEKQQLTGEAKFIRAFFHFYATNLYGNVPLVTTTNYQTNTTISRSDPKQVYRQIIADLTDAQSLLGNNFLTPTGGASTPERVRPNKGAAEALLSRVYLYQNMWDSAEVEATLVINNTSTYGLVKNLDSVFLANSTEAIWQLQPVQPGYNTFDAYNFVLTSQPGVSRTPVALSKNLLNVFEPGDNRNSHWTGNITSSSKKYYYPYKYKVYLFNANQAVTEYVMVLRLAEQYLIRAEARAWKGNLQGAIDDLNIIRNRAGLPNTTATSSQSDVLSAIYHERQVELFTEWGHRWFDLKRTGNITAVMTTVTPQKSNGSNSWNTNWTVFPIPASETKINPNLGQNQGY